MRVRKDIHDGTGAATKYPFAPPLSCVAAPAQRRQTHSIRVRFKHEMGPYTDGRVSAFLAIYPSTISSLGTALCRYKVWDARMPAELTPIAEDAFGKLIVMSNGGPNEGKV
ncbi:MAG: hypothetical protein NTU53_07615 [Planctomycetota bacterium]|nr:hypothetical protein [Planctomycetota bacterium]